MAMLLGATMRWELLYDQQSFCLANFCLKEPEPLFKLQSLERQKGVSSGVGGVVL